MKNFATKSAFGGLVAIALVAIPVLSATPAAAYTCQGSHHYKNGVGTHAAMQGARAIATKNWQNKVKNSYGLPWSVWSIATGKSIQCVTVGGGNKTCVARARPCKYVTGS